MKERNNKINVFRRKRTSLAIMIALTTIPGALQLAYAGAGWGDSQDDMGLQVKTPSYYANSPSGPRDNAACFDAPQTRGDFPGANRGDANFKQPAAQSNCNSGKALRKFIDPLPAIPVASPDKTAYPGSEYYEIAVVEYTQQMHTDLAKPTRLRGYVQIAPNGTVPLYYLNADDTEGAQIMLPNGQPAMAMAKPSYLGPIISSTSGTPTRIKFYNLLPAGAAGNLHLPVDETITGAGFGPDGITKYQQNRVEIHLHGGDNPWISDGTPHQWILPAADELALKAAGKPEMARGVGAKNVPDMPDPGPGAMTYYFPNGQSSRLMFYHDHSLGITRLNVYSGIAAGYVLNDKPGVGENHPELAGFLNDVPQVPLIIQDKTFVPQDIAVQDAKWNAPNLGKEGDLWYPHVYETNQDPASVDGTNPVGRWDWGPWFWPVFPSDYKLPSGEVAATNTVGLSEVSTTPEAFMDTPVVNGVAYPTYEVDPKTYRFRILNAGNDRFLNLGLYVAADKKTTADPANPDTPDGPVNPHQRPDLCDGSNNLPTTDCTEVSMVHFDSSYPAQYGANALASGFPSAGGPNDTGWGVQNAALFPMGVPDPATAGPNIVQIGNEGGLLSRVFDIPSTILNYEYNKRSVTILNVQERGLYLGAAERADVLIDFSQYAGKTLILYNDAPAPVPASDPRIDYYTGNDDNTAVGGAPRTQPGYGPNTRTVMQIVVKATPPQAPLDVAGLKQALPKAYATTQSLPVVPEPEFAAAFPNNNMPAARNNAAIYTGSIYVGQLQGMKFTTQEAINYFPVPISTINPAKTCTTLADCNAALAAQKTNPIAPTGTTVVPNGKGLVNAPAGTLVNAYVENKAIQELFDPTYGRMNATLGVELPFTSALAQTTIPLSYVDPVTETVADGETQFWKITHNGVDTHPVHFHLVNVQVINRIGWDGTRKPPLGDEFGWKETVKMNPLEDIVVAVRAKKPDLQGVVAADGSVIPSNAFGLPLSKRLRDPSQPTGSALGFTQINPFTNTPAVVTNKVDDYGWEYSWHCHILGHEENDFMRPFKFNANEVATAAPTNLTLNVGHLAWQDNATTEYAYKVERGVMNGGVATYTNLTATIPFDQQNLGEAPLANATSFTDTGFVAVDPAKAMVAPVVNMPTVVALEWSYDANASGFVVERDEGQGFSTVGTVGAGVAGAAVSFSDTNLTPNTTYKYRVVAHAANSYFYRVTAVGATTPNGMATIALPEATATSNVLQVTTAPMPQPQLRAVTDLKAQVNSNTSMTLIWTDNSTLETGYQIERCVGSVSSCRWNKVTTGIAPTGSLTSGGMFGGPMSVTLTSTSNLPQNLINYRVAPLNNAIVGPVSNTATVNLDAVPVAPTGVTVTPLVGQVVVNWVDVAPNNTEYRVRTRYQTGVNAKGNPVWSNWVNASVVPAIGGNAQTVTLMAAQIGSNYVAGRTLQFQVAARNSRDPAWSTSVTVVVQ